MKSARVILTTLIIMATIGGCVSFKKLNYSRGRNTNVCKELTGNVLLYTIFVDTRSTAPWTEFDIRSTLDSVRVAVNWIESKSRDNSIPLNIITDYYIGQEYTTVKKNLPEESVYLSATEPNLNKGLIALNKWSDYIARKAGASFPVPEKDGIPEIRKPKNKERLIAYLRDEYNVESVALLFMVNNYYKSDISLAINTLSTKDVEYAIVSYKYPSEIAHNFLHLFGAADLYPTIYKRNEKNIALAEAHFPNDIMRDPYAKKIRTLDIGDFTKYLIGWSNNLDAKYEPLLYDRRVLDN